MLNRYWTLCFGILFAILSGYAFSEVVAVPPDGFESRAHPENERLASGDAINNTIPHQLYTPFTTANVFAKDENVLDHLREAIEEVQLEDNLVITEVGFREELFGYLKSNFKGAGDTAEDLDTALAKAVVTEMLGRQLIGSETVDNIIGLLNRPVTPDNNDGREDMFVRVAKKDLVRRIVKGEAAPPKYDPSLALHADLIYQVIEKSKEPLLSEIDDWMCYCGGKDCCRCPDVDPNESWQRSKAASNPKKLWFACICTCCPCYIPPPDPPGTWPFPPKLASPMSIFCALLKMGVCPW